MGTLDKFRTWIGLRKPETRDIRGEASWLTTPALAGVVVTPDTALSLPAVKRAVDIISTSLASLPLVVYRRGETGPQPDIAHPLYYLLSVEPNAEVSAFNFWQSIFFNSCVYGNGYAEIVRNKMSGQVEALYLLDPRQVSVHRADSGSIYYQSSSQDATGRQTDTRHLAENVLHIALPSTDGLVGISPITLHKQLIGNMLAAEAAAAAAFGQSSTPTGIIEVPAGYPADARKNLRESWQAVHRGPTNTGTIAFLDDGCKFNPVKVSLTELQYLEIRKFGIEEVARIFGVPMHKLGIMGASTYNNLEQEELSFWQSTLRVWCERAESEVNRKLFTRKERAKRYAEFNMNAAIRGDSAAEISQAKELFGMGVYTINDVCRQFGKQTIGAEGDRRYFSVQLTPIEDVGVSVDQTQTPSLPSDPASEPIADTSTQPSPEAVDAVRGVLVDALRRAVTKEKQAVRRAIKKDGFPAWLDTFYSEHRGYLTNALAPGLAAWNAITGQGVEPEKVADALVVASLAQLRNVEGEAVEEWADNLDASDLVGKVTSNG